MTSSKCFEVANQLLVTLEERPKAISDPPNVATMSSGPLAVSDVKWGTAGACCNKRLGHKWEDHIVLS